VDPTGQYACGDGEGRNCGESSWFFPGSWPDMSRSDEQACSGKNQNVGCMPNQEKDLPEPSLKDIFSTPEDLCRCNRVHQREEDGIYPAKRVFNVWSVDWIDVGINVIGGLGEFTLVAAPPVWGLSERVQIVGIARDIYTSDYSGLAENGIVGIIKFGLEQKNATDLIPIVGAVSNMRNIY
jgi:hypothetical protein